MSNGNSKTVGVIGGMGPAAAIDFVNTVMSVSGAVRDEDHIPMLIDNNTQIPNRQAAILRGGPSPGPAIAATGKRLEEAGADFLVMPCNTAHAFQADLLEAITIPFISIIDVAVEASQGYRKLGILATEGCIKFGGYQQALISQGLEPVIPTDDEISELSKRIIQIKTGDTGDEVRDSILSLVHSLHDKGCDAVISGCTEIPLAIGDAEPPCPVISSTRELAIATVNHAKAVL